MKFLSLFLICATLGAAPIYSVTTSSSPNASCSYSPSSFGISQDGSFSVNAYADVRNSHPLAHAQGLRTCQIDMFAVVGTHHPQRPGFLEIRGFSDANGTGGVPYGRYFSITSDHEQLMRIPSSHGALRYDLDIPITLGTMFNIYAGASAAYNPPSQGGAGGVQAVIKAYEMVLIPNSQQPVKVYVPLSFEPIPEPGSLTLSVFGGILIYLRRKRKNVSSSSQRPSE